MRGETWPREILMLLFVTALLLLGAEPITSFSDGTPAAQACSTIYEDTKRTTLGMYRWSFTIAKKELARDTASPNSEWTYQYLLPNDILNGVPEAVRTTKSPGGQLFKNWEIGQAAGTYAVLMTEATEIHIDYQRVVSEGYMPSYFIQLLDIKWLAFSTNNNRPNSQSGILEGYSIRNSC